MKNLSTLFFACFFLAFMSCSKEEIISTDKDSDSIIINTDTSPLQGEASPASEESTGEGYSLNNNNPTVVVTIKSAIDYLATESDMSLFHYAIVKTGMDATISGNGPYTIFAPNNEAFQDFLENNNWTSLDDIPTGLLTNFVKFHISTTGVKMGDLTMDTEIPIMINNQSIYVHATSSPTYITLGLSQANLLTSDIELTNGNINKIDAVLAL